MMGFASAWLHTSSLYPKFIKEAPHINTGIIAVIPSYDEPAVIDLLESLAACKKPLCSTEVIIVINAPKEADKQSIKNNKLNLKNITSWKKGKNPFFRLFVLYLEKPEIKGWGVGLARKTGMDEALRRFDQINRLEGVIACLDGDCKVSPNYFIALEEELLNRKNRNACSVYFEHPLSGDEYPVEIYKSITQYELHLRYYYQALKHTGFPNVFHTVGSTIAVRALTYMKAGGMNRRQAGEDFYFVQKLIPAGGYFSLNSATVYPSPRVSRRVPFGTGHAVGRMVERGEKIFMTYHPDAFSDLRLFFADCNEAFKPEGNRLEILYSGFPESIRSFMTINDWQSKITEISDNTGGLAAFRKRFFEWFNMFRVVKYLNHSHREKFSRIPAGEAAGKIMGLSGYSDSAGSDVELLLKFREIERRV